MKLINISTFPHATPEKPHFAKDATREELSFVELHNKVVNSAWSPALVRNNKRSSDNFESAEVMALDFDGELTAKEATFRLRENGLNYSLTYSKSHQIDKSGEGPKDRFRIIIPLSERISDKKIFDYTWNYLHKLFPEIDTQCKDPSRFYFASKSEGELYLDGSELEPKKPTIVEIKREFKEGQSKSVKEKVILGSGVMYFLRNAKTGIKGGWDLALVMAAKECFRGGMTRDDAYDLLESVCPTPFDKKDEERFDRGWKKGVKAGLYKSLQTVDKKELSEDLFEFLDEELADSFHVYEDDCGNRGIILEEKLDGLVVESGLGRLTAVIGRMARENFNIFLDAVEAKRHAENYILYTNTIKEEPRTVAFLNEDCLAYHKLDFDLVEGECPIFDELVGRSTNKKALMAFIWSLFVTDSDRQQYIWLCGGGGNGKTSLQRLLERLLGNACIEKRVGSVHNNRFFTHSLIGKRLAVFSDTNSATVVRTETVKEITGGGRIEVEPKGKSPFTIKPDVKLIFISNNDPDISSKNADLRRLIMCKIDALPKGVKQDPFYIDKLWNERSAILYKCKAIYEELDVGIGSIPHETILSKEVAEDSEVEFESVFEECLQLDEDSHLTNVQLHDTIKHAIKSAKGMKKADFIAWIDRTYGIKRKRKIINSKQKTIYEGIRAR